MNGAIICHHIGSPILTTATETRQFSPRPSRLNPSTSKKTPLGHRESQQAPPSPPSTPSQSKFKGFLRKLTKRFSKKQSPAPVPLVPHLPPTRTYEFVNPNQLRDSPSPRPKYGYITGSPRSSFTPPSPSWLSRNVPLSPPSRTIHNSYAEFTGSLGENNSFAIHSTFLPPDLTGRPPRRSPSNRPISPISPASPLLAPPSPSLPARHYSPPPSPRAHRYYRPPTPPKGRRRRPRAPSAPEESILGDLASTRPTHHQRSNSSPQPRDIASSSTVSRSHPRLILLKLYIRPRSLTLPYRDNKNLPATFIPHKRTVITLTFLSINPISPLSFLLQQTWTLITLQWATTHPWAAIHQWVIRPWVTHLWATIHTWIMITHLWIIPENVQTLSTTVVNLTIQVCSGSRIRL